MKMTNGKHSIKYYINIWGLIFFFFFFCVSIVHGRLLFNNYIADSTKYVTCLMYKHMPNVYLYVYALFDFNWEHPLEHSSGFAAWGDMHVIYPWWKLNFTCRISCVSISFGWYWSLEWNDFISHEYISMHVSLTHSPRYIYFLASFQFLFFFFFDLLKKCRAFFVQWMCRWFFFLLFWFLV